MSKKTANLAIRLSPEIKEALEVAAKADRRSVSSYVEKVLADDLEAKGLTSGAGPGLGKGHSGE